jgi:hypothetical protein
MAKLYQSFLQVENLFLKEKMWDISSEAYLEDSGVAYLSLDIVEVLDI